jgi:hypothetical protein
MEPLIKYLNDKEFKTIDLTDVMTKSNYGKYAISAYKNQKSVFYFKRKIENEIHFKIANAADISNYYLMNKDNYLTIEVNNNSDDKLNDNLRR